MTTVRHPFIDLRNLTATNCGLMFAPTCKVDFATVADQQRQDTGRVSLAVGEVAQSTADKHLVEARNAVELIAASGEGQQVVDTVVQSVLDSQAKRRKHVIEMAVILIRRGGPLLLLCSRLAHGTS